MKWNVFFVSTLCLFFLFFGCKSSPEKTNPQPTQKQKRVVMGKPFPNLEQLRKKLNLALDRKPTTNIIKPELEELLNSANLKLAECKPKDSALKCDSKSIAGLHLLIGDLSFDLGQYPNAETNYRNAVLDYFEIFETEKSQFIENMKVNEDEIEKRGNTPYLLAGQAFLKTYFSFNAYKTYQDIVRSERRYAAAVKALDRLPDAETALARESLAMDKVLEFRKDFETFKRDLLALKEKLQKDFSSYEAHILNWESQL
jgi:hypothetical protein